MYEFENIADKPLAEKVSDAIIELIITNKIKAGEKLPNEFQLAESLKVGRSTIREAVKILVSRNIVEIRRGSGTFVCKEPGVVDDPLGFTFIKDKKQLAMDLISVRMLIEPQMAALAARNADESDLREISELCLKIEQLIKNNKDHTESDIAFHACIARASRNIVLQSIIPIIDRSGIDFITTLTQRILKDETIKTHRKIVDAILSHDEKAASEAMAEHLSTNLHYMQLEMEGGNSVL